MRDDLWIEVEAETLDTEGGASSELALAERRPALNRADDLESRPLKAIIENYVRYYAAGEGHTARAKRYDLQYFLEFIAGDRARIDAVTVQDWTLQVTKDFVDHRLQLGEAPSTVARRLATIKHFGRTLAERVAGYINPAREVKSPVLALPNPKGLNEEEIELLLHVAQEQPHGKRPFLLLRNRYLLELLLRTGLRADEVRLLVLGQISTDGFWLRNVRTKGRKFRSVYLDSEIQKLTMEYLPARAEELSTLFPCYDSISETEKLRLPVLISAYRADPSRPGSFGLSPKSIWRIVSAFGKAALQLSGGRAANLHPHKLRHTFAHGLLESSRDIRLVAQALGHSDVRTTMRYTERSEEEIAAAIEKKLAKSSR